MSSHLCTRVSPDMYDHLHEYRHEADHVYRIRFRRSQRGQTDIRIWIK